MVVIRVQEELNGIPGSISEVLHILLVGHCNAAIEGVKEAEQRRQLSCHWAFKIKMELGYFSYLIHQTTHKFPAFAPHCPQAFLLIDFPAIVSPVPSFADVIIGKYQMSIIPVLHMFVLSLCNAILQQKSHAALRLTWIYCR